MNLEPLSLETSLGRLLHDPGLRARWLVGEAPELGLESLDPDEVVRAARNLQNDVFSRRHAGCGGLRTAFPQTLAAACDGEAALVEAFQQHPAYAAWREIPYGGFGLCLEEAFFRFAESAGLGDADVRRREYLLAAGKALLVDPDPAFLTPTGFCRVAGGWAARHGDEIFAAVDGRLVIGRAVGLA